MRLDLPEEASQDSEKLLIVVPNNISTIYQIANLFKHHNELNLSIKWFTFLTNNLPIDPGILSRIGKIFYQTV